MDHRDHDPPWWTRSVQDHLGPRSNISLMRKQILPRRLYENTFESTPSRTSACPCKKASHASSSSYTTLPPSELMNRAFQALRTCATNMLPQDRVTNAPTPPYYHFPPSHTPHTFIGLGKFVAGRIHQMLAAKSPLATHPAWFDVNRDPTCPRSGAEPETFRDASHTCPARPRVRELLLKDVCSRGPHADLWTEPILV